MVSIDRLLSRGSSDESGKPEDPVVMEINDETAEDAFSALSSETAREILSQLYEQPNPVSEVADSADTSLQNANYHLNNLMEAGLIEVQDIQYSDQGREMRVFAPTNGALVLFAGDDVERSSLRETIKRLLLPVGALAVVSVVVDVIVRDVLLSLESSTGTDAPLSAGGESVATPAIDPTVLGLLPGVLFFFGGLFTLMMFYFVYEE